MSIRIPLQVASRRLQKEESLVEAVNGFLSLLLTTPCGSCVSDPDFGFVFNNLRFEIFNESEGVVYDSTDAAHDNNNPDDLYVKKISGSSKNLNTFAAEFKRVIETYERRLTNVAVSMTYIREAKNIYVTVRGFLPEIEKDYQYTTYIKIWN